MTAQLALALPTRRVSVTLDPPKRNAKGRINCARPGCLKTMVPKRSTGRFCSTKCRVRNHRQREQQDELHHAIVFGTNADLMAEVAPMHIRDGDLVADVTYGRGQFWRKTDRRRFTLITSDIATPADRRLDFRHLPDPDESFDVVVFDPPYVHDLHYRMTKSTRYNGGVSTQPLASLDDILALYKAGMTEARRVLKPRGRLFVKGMDQVDGRRPRWFHLELPAIADKLGMFLRDKFTLVPTTTPSARPLKRQIHARKSHSFLWVFEREP